MSKLPSGWTATTLGDIARLVRNGLFRTRPSDEPVGAAILRISAVRPDGLDLAARRFVSGLSPDETIKYSVEQDDLLITRYNGSRRLVGMTALVPAHEGPLLHPDKLIRVVLDKSRADPRFVNYQMASPRLRSFLEPRIRTTAGQSGISGADVKAMPLWLPSLTEQRRIVELLGDHFSRLDAASETLRLAAQRVERLWLSAVTRALFSDRGRPTLPLADLLDLSVGGIWGSSPGEDECDVHVLRVTEMSRDGSLEPSTAVLRSISKRQLDKRELRAGDLLLEKSGGGPNTPVGRVGLVGELAGPAICSNFMQLMRANADRVLPEFLHVYLQSFHMRGGTLSMQTASTNIRNIKASEYVRLDVPIPSMDEQARIVRELEELGTSRQRLSSGLLAATRRGVGLRRALLDAAFSGQRTGRASDLDRVEELAEANA